MTNFMKLLTRILPILLIAAVVGACGSPQEPAYITNSGNAQGTTYQIKYLSPKGKNFKQDIIQRLKDIDLSMSGYIANSKIMEINEGDTWVEVDTMFMKVLHRSLEIAEESDGDFDPTIGPLVRYWGFGFDKLRSDINADSIRKIKNHTGYTSIGVDGNRVRIPKGFNLDLNAIAQGYTVDNLAGYLEKQGVEHYMVEVGGEVLTKGVNEKQEIWKIGVDKPQKEVDAGSRFQFVLALDNAALATSGNYRKFWVDEETGIKYAHTIDPKSGYPAKNRLLSTSIIAPTAMDADAFATTCMVKGVEGCKKLVDNHPDLEAYLIYSETDSTQGLGEYVTPGFQAFVVK